MNKLIYKIAILFIAVSLVSCEKGLMTFNNEQADVYFSDAGKAPVTLAKDSLYVSFSFTKSTDSVRNIIVAATGGPVSYDRAYSVVVNPLSTAVSGTHFEALPEKFFIKKNALTDTIKLKLIKTPEMESNTYFVQLDLLANENFGNNWKTRVVAGKPIKTISTRIAFNDIIRKPGKWSDAWFGTFSKKKLFFLNDDMNLTPQYLDTDITIPEITACAKIAQRHLNELAAAGKTVYEDNDTPMTMAPAAK